MVEEIRNEADFEPLAQAGTEYAGARSPLFTSSSKDVKRDCAKVEV